MNTGLSGDDVVSFPFNAVSASEILDEPGLTSVSATSPIDLTNAVSTLALHTITCPADGFVIATGTVYAQTLTGGPTARIRVGISGSPGGFGPLSYYHSGDSLKYAQTISLHEVFTVTAGAHTYYLQASESSENWTIRDRRFTLLYVPTTYGTVSASAMAGTETELVQRDNYGFHPQSTTEPISSEQRLSQLSAQIDAIQREMNALRGQLK
jgi:hypothetical protein